MTGAAAWDRRPDESAPAHEALVVYLEAGARRGLTMVAQTLTKSRTLIARWSSRHDWPARARAYDNHLTAAWAAEATTARASLAHRHLAVAHAALEKVAARVKAVDPAELSISEVVRLWDVAVRTERDALLTPIRLEVSGPDGRPIAVAATDEERHDRMLALRRELEVRTAPDRSPGGASLTAWGNPDDPEDPDDEW